jgi:hypothetical protein
LRQRCLGAGGLINHKAVIGQLIGNIAQDFRLVLNAQNFELPG